jgi:hypothetical protein
MSGWGFPTQFLPQAGMHAGLHVMWPLLLSFNQNWNVLIHFSKISIINAHKSPTVL